jgi:lantibiotic biosynthesis protein
MTTSRPDSARLALATAGRLLDPESITGASLDGLAGTALLHARLSAVDDVFADAAGRHWAAAAQHAAAASSTGAGIYSSPSGVAASIIIGTPYLPDPERYASAVEEAVRWLNRQAMQIAADDQGRRRPIQPLSSWAGYDVISGPAGIGRILLAALAAGHVIAEPGLRAMLTTLTRMIASSVGIPGWLIPAQAGQRARLHPSGEAATGLAHGVAGPLALLSIAHEVGYSVRGQLTAIRAAADWLLHWQVNSCWAPAITGNELVSGIPDPMPGRRDAWCYGTPGIARTLILAAHALGDQRLTLHGWASLRAMAARPVWDVEGPTICHGYAGVIQSAGRDLPALADLAANAVSTCFDASAMYGFRHLGEGAASDRPGLLTGAAGIALTLADYAALPSTQVTSPWDTVLLLV